MDDEDKDKAQLALLAHDLRTPLTAMRITAELIGTGPLTTAQEEQLKTLVASIDALADMTGALLPAPREDDRGRAISEPVADILGQTCDLFRFAAERKGLTVELHPSGEAGCQTTVHGAALRRVLGALLDNAVKYTADGAIDISFGSGSITVSDTGPGIPEAERARLFRPFVRGSAGRGSGSGSGLGLWGASETMRQLGGALELDAGNNGGCRFKVVLPSEETADSGNADMQDARESGLAPMHVLIVDDNETNCRLLSALLESFEISSDVAFGGAEALSLARVNDYDAALLDLNMPGMSGVETARELRGFRSVQELPLIAVTAAVETLEKNGAPKELFEDVLAKPLSPAALFDAMKRARATSQPA